MKCIILAAGYSKRLYPLTQNMPKQFIKIGDKLMIEHILDNISHINEIDEVIVVVNNKFFPIFDDWSKSFCSGRNSCKKFSKKIFDKKITILNDGTNSNEERLGTVGDLHFAISSRKIDDEVMVIGGDNLFETDLRNMISVFNDKKRSVIAARDLGDPQKLALKLGVVVTDANLKIIDFEEKPPQPKSSLAATLIYIFTKEDVRELENCIRMRAKLDNAGNFIRHLITKREVYCYKFMEPWFDIGNHEELRQVQDIYSKKA